MTRQGPPELPGHSTVPSLLMEILENQQCQDGSVDLYSPFDQANPLFKGSPVSQGFLIILFIIATDGWKVICVCRRESWAARLRCIVPDMPKTTSSPDMENVSWGKHYLCLFSIMSRQRRVVGQVYSTVFVRRRSSIAVQ